MTIDQEVSVSHHLNKVLTRREMEVAYYVSKGLSNAAIAEVLQVTYYTINQHLKHIYKKLDIHSKGELISAYLWD